MFRSRTHNRFIFPLGLLLGLWVVSAAFTSLASAQSNPNAVLHKNDMEIELRSDARILADEMAATGGVILADPASSSSAFSLVPQVQFRRGNVQVNDPSLDFTQQFTGFRPFLHATQSETSVAAHGRNIVASYNSSAGMHLIQIDPVTLAFDRLQIGGFSTSTDGGKTFTSGFFPGVEGLPFTFGDPSIDVDRNGNFFFTQLGVDTNFNGTVQVNKSTDGGRTWANAAVAAVDDGSDKEWLAVGPDPFHKSQDNVYVTWTSFQPTGSELRFTKSTDGGQTWTSKTLFAPGPDPDPTHPQNFIQFSNPVVDSITGTLYIPFVHFSNADTDFIQLLVSRDGGNTFSFATFNVPGALDPTLLPIVQPGEFTDCGGGGLRLVLHIGSNIGGGRFGLARYVQSTRLIVQPGIAARAGVVYLAWNQSTSPFFGDPNGNSNIMFMRSDDGGTTWTSPLQVNASGDPHHVHPSLTSDDDPQSVHIAFYTQHADGTIDVDMANSHDRGNSFAANRTVRITPSSMVLPPTNIPIPIPSNPFRTTNYDRNIQPCYALGEYLSARATNGQVYVEFGDTRNNITEPVDPLDPLSGQTHTQEDVFFQIVKAQ
jgi:hypothetical protein